MSGGGGSQTTTEQSETRYDPYIAEAQQGAAGSAYNLTQPFMYSSPFARAAQTADQLKAYDLSRLSARDVFTAAPNTVPTDASLLNFSPAQASASTVNPASMTASTMTPASMRASQVTGGEIQSFMNPYLQGVLDPTIANMNRARNTTDAQIGAKYAAMGGLGGSGAAIARGQNNRAFGEQVATTSAQLMAQGYDKATATALANTQLRQDADKTNATFGQQASMTNAGYLNDASKANASFAQQAGMSNAEMAQQIALANQASQNQFQQTALDYGLKAPQANSQLATQQQQRELAAIQAILAGGNAQQAFAQSAMDVPKDALTWYNGLIPQVYDADKMSTKTEPKKDSGMGQGLLGLGSSLIGAAGKAGGFGALLGLSDERTKTNIRKLGKDPETGLEMYEYDYIDDVEAAKKSGEPMGPKRVSPMAQEIEKEHAGTTKEIGGKLVVDVGLLSKKLKKAA